MKILFHKQRPMAAAMASWRLRGKPGPLSAEAISPAAAPAAAPVPTTKPTDDETQITQSEAVEAEKARLEFLEKEDLEEMSHEELRDVAEGLKCVVEADGGTVPAEVVDQDVEHMDEDQLRGYRTRLFAAIEAVGEFAHSRQSTPPRARNPDKIRASSGKNPPSVVLKGRTLSTPRQPTPPESTNPLQARSARRMRERTLPDSRKPLAEFRNKRQCRQHRPLANAS